MSNLFFTADLHFGHAKVIEYCNRPYANADEMDEALIANWNTWVNPDDRIIILGDVFFCRPDKAISILSRLNGSKELVYGNHDKRLRGEPKVKKMFSRIHPELYTEIIDGNMVVMCHFPLLTWERSNRGSFHLHGHCHGKVKFDPSFRRLDVGVDPNGYAPISWHAVKSKLETAEAGDVRQY